MNEREQRPLQGILSGRGFVIELWASAVFLALGISLVANVISDSWSALIELSVGLFIVAISVGYLALRYLETNRTIRFHGCVAYDQGANEVREIPGYHLSGHISFDLKAAFAENEDLKHRLGKMQDYLLTRHTDKPSSDEPIMLLNEALEYWTLGQLSTHLRRYFDSPRFDATLLQTYTRDNIPTELLSNRFLDLFSKDPADRPIFQKRDQTPGVMTFFAGSTEQIGGKEVWTSISAPGGATYSRFHLVLPAKGTISRDRDGRLLIDTTFLRLLIRLQYDGGSSGRLPDQFMKYYVGPGKLEGQGVIGFVRVVALGVSGEVSIKIKPRALFSRRAWEYYMWADSFLESIQNRANIHQFMERINWTQIEAQLRSADGWRREQLDASRHPPDLPPPPLK
jgi:hypothetical protein